MKEYAYEVRGADGFLINEGTVEASERLANLINYELYLHPEAIVSIKGA